MIQQLPYRSSCPAVECRCGIGGCRRRDRRDDRRCCLNVGDSVRHSIAMLLDLIKISRRYESSILRERSAARATVTGWLSRVMIRPVGVLGSRATPSWMNSERRS